VKQRYKMLLMCLPLLFVTSSLRAQDMTGDWQGALPVSQGKPLRIVLKISRGEDGIRNARFYSIDQTTDGYSADPITVTDPRSGFVFRFPQASYEGQLSADGNAIDGTWIQGGRRALHFERATQGNAWATDSAHHTLQFVSVEPGVKLEVIDWGGTGRPLIFLAGLAGTAHVFDKFAPKFTAKYHVYGITRRGFGESSSPAPTEQNYASDRLADDVLSVIHTLNLQKPVVAGHSMAGEELSSIGSRHPEAVSGLIYLDASFPYAYYDRALGDPQLDELDVKRRIEQLLPSNGDPEGQRQAIQGLLDILPQLEKDLRGQLSTLQAIASPDQSFPPQPPNPALAMVSGERKYTQIRARCLAIVAAPHDPDSGAILATDPAHHAAAVAADVKRTTDLSNAFAAGVPSATVVRLHDASHSVWESNEAEVFKAMNDFIDTLPLQ
jgi:pimeloyl-ACP methyl ester carboxylesterase